jgi:hypothetical protein
MARFSRITKKMITRAVSNNDLNDALFDFQCAIGIDDGGVAGIVFSGGWDVEWSAADHPRRRTMMDHYIKSEKLWAQN